MHTKDEIVVPDSLLLEVTLSLCHIVVMALCENLCCFDKPAKVPIPAWLSVSDGFLVDKTSTRLGFRNQMH